MAISYVEDIVSEFYEEQGYFVGRDVQYQVPKEESGKKVSGWKDIDVLAINENDVLIIECKAFTGNMTADKMAKKLSSDYASAEKSVKEKYKSLIENKQIKKIFVVDYTPAEELKIELDKKGVKVYLLNELMKDFLKLLHKKYPNGKTGGSKRLTRTLIYLLHSEFFKDYQKREKEREIAVFLGQVLGT